MNKETVSILREFMSQLYLVVGVQKDNPTPEQIEVLVVHGFLQCQSNAVLLDLVDDTITEESIQLWEEMFHEYIEELINWLKSTPSSVVSEEVVVHFGTLTPFYHEMGLSVAALFRAERDQEGIEEAQRAYQEISSKIASSVDMDLINKGVSI